MMDRLDAAVPSHRVEGLQGSLHYAFILHRKQRARMIHVHLDHRGIKEYVNELGSKAKQETGKLSCVKCDISLTKNGEERARHKSQQERATRARRTKVGVPTLFDEADYSSILALTTRVSASLTSVVALRNENDHAWTPRVGA